MASPPLLLAIDVGTGSCRAVLFDLSGEQAAICQAEYSHEAAAGVPGSQVFDTDAIWRLVCGCVQGALSTAGVSGEAVAAVATTSMREGMVLYDSAGRETWACPNVDSRAAEEAGELVSSGAAREIYGLSGDWVSITAPARFRWLRRHEPALLDEAAHMGMLADWVTTRLTGEFATDASLGSSSGMFELRRRDWSKRIIELCDADAAIFPPVLDSGTVVGEVTSAAAGETGLSPATPVVTAGADTQLALAGLGAFEPGRFSVVGGTFWQHTVVLDAPTIDPEARLRTLCHTAPELFMMEGIGFYSGLVMRWFRDAFCGGERDRALAEGCDPYAALEAEAATVQAATNGLFGLFSNVMQTDRWVHASPTFIGFDVTDPAGSGRAAFFRAIEESAVFVVLAHLRIIEELGGSPVREVMFAGGASKGILWPQILSDVLNLPVHVPLVKEATALGAAVYAGAGVGLLDTPGTATAGSAGLERTFFPGPEAARLAEAYEDWAELYRRTLPLSEAGLVRPLWRAAGADVPRPKGA